MEIDEVSCSISSTKGESQEEMETWGASSSVENFVNLQKFREITWIQKWEECFTKFIKINSVEMRILLQPFFFLREINFGNFRVALT